MDVIKDTEKMMQGALDHLKQELKGLRTGRANPAILETVTLEVYGAKMRLQDVASISVPEPRQILITPFDAGNVHAIAKGIEAANLNMQPIVDSNVIRLKVPEMDQNVRNEMVKLARKKCEEAKVGIRNARRDGNDIIRKQKADGDVAEDVMKKTEKRIQELTDKYCKTADGLAEDKEKEITTI